MTPTPAGPAQRTPPPERVARVCLNGHLADAELRGALVAGVDVNRADPLAVRTTGLPCVTCGSGTIVGCPCCGYPIPGRSPTLAYAVPHFCIVCGEFYPWTFQGEFYGTLAEILAESPRLDPAAAERALTILDRLREGVAAGAEVAGLRATFESLGGSDAELAGQILAVVLPVRGGPPARLAELPA